MGLPILLEKYLNGIGLHDHRRYDVFNLMSMDTVHSISINSTKTRFLSAIDAF